MSSAIESLRRLEQEVATVHSFIRRMNQPGNRLTQAIQELLTTSTEVVAFVDEEWRKIISCDENRRTFIQEQSCRLHQAMTLFHLRCEMSIYEVVSEMERRMTSTEVRVRDSLSMTEDLFGPPGVPFARHPTVNFHAYQGGIINYNVTNVNERTTNTNSGHTTTNTTVASSNRF